MLLETICNSAVYEKNAYYLLGVPVGLSGRKLKRKLQDLQDIGAMGGNEWEREFDKYLLGSCKVPDSSDVNDLVERIKDPEFAITEAFFWFWPVSELDDPALVAISAGERDAAYREWRTLAVKSTKESVIAKHNLAVLFHYYAIDAEAQRLSELKGTSAKSFLNVLDQYWRTAFKYWEELVDDDTFWDAFLDRVKAIDDPRLDEKFVTEFRREFPIAFDNINGDFLAEYARKGKLEDAKRHFTYMTETMSDSDDVDESLNVAFKQQIDKIRLLIKRCADKDKPEEGMKDIRALLDTSNPLFNVFRYLLPPTNRVRRDLMNDVAKACHDRLPSYANKTDDFDGALTIERDLYSLAESPSLKNNIQKSITQLEGIIQSRRDADTCWYCKTYRKGTPRKVVKMYGELAPDLSQFGRVSYSTRQVQVPVCARCSSKFSTHTVRDYPAVKTAIAAGWRIGEGPSDSEINAVWADIAKALNLLGGGRRRGF